MTAEVASIGVQINFIPLFSIVSDTINIYSNVKDVKKKEIAVRELQEATAAVADAIRDI